MKIPEQNRKNEGLHPSSIPSSTQPPEFPFQYDMRSGSTCASEEASSEKAHDQNYFKNLTLS